MLLCSVRYWCSVGCYALRDAVFGTDGCRAAAGVSHVIVDEIHERGINEDFILIVLKDLLKVSWPRGC